jgi:hypothetical protein
MQAAAAASAIHHVFVIAMENTDAKEIYGNHQRAPYIHQAILPNLFQAGCFP